MASNSGEWKAHAPAYWGLIEDEQFDSRYLREAGLIPNVVDLIGDASQSTLLDAGTGTGWLFDHVKPAKAFACDVVQPHKLADGVTFRNDNVASLSFESGTFDIVVASLLLLYCEDLDRVCAELCRVSKPQTGRLIVAIMHPYFYRTGSVEADGAFRVQRNLAESSSFEFKIGGRVGPFQYYYRQLPDYVNTLVKAGWTIKSMRDWFIDIKDYRRFVPEGAKAAISRSGRVPLFAFFECVRRPL